MSNPATAVTDPDTGKRDYPYPRTGEMFTSATTVLNGTEGKPWLPGWAAGIAAEYAIDNLLPLARLKHAVGRTEAVALAKKQAALIRDRKRDTGGYVHDVVEALVLWQASPEGRGADLSLPLLPDRLKSADYDGEPVEDVAGWMVEGYLNWVSDFCPQFLAAEMTVFHPGLKVAGTLDEIAFLPRLGIGRSGRFVSGPGVTCCVDVKTGRHLSVTWPEQIAIYRRCPECLLPLGELRRTPETECGAVLHLRPEYPRGYRFMLISGEDDAAAWGRAQEAIRLYRGRNVTKAKPGKVCYPLRADGTIQPPRVADLDGEGYGRVISPLVKAGVGDLEQLAAMTAGQLLKVKGIGAKTVDGIRVMLDDHGLHLAGEAHAPEAVAA
ncbi:MAG TPA: helix-hairpin-helix domain-containing protein [Streptosporangiaceae bacterium]|nr:helix-hairpin-helix domain-containing protein [Streptosporangiaceae bacterium]